MTLASHLLGIAGALLAFAVVIEMLRRRRLRERHALWWFVAGLLALIAGVFPRSLQWVANSLGVEVPTNLVFFVSIIILFLVSLQQSAELTTVESRVRTLAEHSALQDKRIRDLEAATKAEDNSREGTT